MFLLDRRALNNFDWLGFFLVLALSVLSLLFVLSATYTPEQPYSIFFKKQLFGVLSGIVLYGIMSFIDHKALESWGYVLYFVTIVLLVFTLVKGSVGGLGAQRWISLGVFKFQSSELAKLFFPAFFTYHMTGYLSEKLGGQISLRIFFPIIIVLLVSSLLILKQPHLGTALIVLFSGLIMLWLAGIPKNFFIISALLFLLLTPLALCYLKPYQKKRIIVFLGGGSSDRERYQIEQSHIAIGSGGIWGKGYLQGTQNRLNFLPESRTDFIFSVIAEEWGFCGSLLVVLLYVMLFVRCLSIALTINNVSMQLLAIGLVIPSILATIINISMVLGLLPIVGIPLPFLTYGVTHLWISFISFGWFNSIVSRRFMYEFDTKLHEKVKNHG